MTRTAADATAIRRRRNGVAVAFALGGVNLATWGPRLPAIRADLAVGDGTLGLLVAGMTVASLLGLGVSSWLLGRLGPRRGIGAFLSLVAVGVALVGIASGLWHSPALTEVGLVAMGFGIGTTDVMMNVEGAAVERESGRVLMPLLHACWSAGAVLGSGIGAAAAALDVPPVAQFVAESALTVVAVWIAVRGFPEFEPALEAPPPVVERVRAWFAGWGDLRLLLIGVVMLGVELGEGSANTWLTLGAARGHGLSPATAALYFTAFAVAETACRALGGPVVDRLGRVATVRITTAAGVVGIALFILGGSPVVVLLGAVLWAIGVSMGFPLGTSAAAQSGPGSAARVSVVTSLGYLANLAGPPVVGYLSQAVGLLGALWLLAAFFVVAFLAAGALVPRRPVPGG
ncbi:MAG TPA: MFS transporter [Amnibacterium sp.]|nr:MFS transporter [Amnibacterium sp.]